MMNGWLEKLVDESLHVIQKLYFFLVTLKSKSDSAFRCFFLVLGFGSRPPVILLCNLISGTFLIAELHLITCLSDEGGWRCRSRLVSNQLQPHVYRIKT